MMSDRILGERYRVPLCPYLVVGNRRLVKIENGQITVLAEDFVPYVTGKSYQVKIAAQGSSLQVSIDGSPVFSVNDSSHSSGTVALYSCANAGSYFDDILVEGLS